MKHAFALLTLAISFSAFAQQDLSSSNRDSTQNGVLSGTTSNPMRDDYGTQVPSTQPVAPSQTSATNNPVNVYTGTMPSQQPTSSAVNSAQQPVPQPIPQPIQPGTQQDAGTMSGTTSAPAPTPIATPGR